MNFNTYEEEKTREEDNTFLWCVYLFREEVLFIGKCWGKKEKNK